MNPSQDRLALIARIRSAVADVLLVSGYGFNPDGSISLRGSLLGDAWQAQMGVQRALAQLGYTARVRPREDASGTVDVLIVAGLEPAAAPAAARPMASPALPWVLLGVTVLSVMFVGGLEGDPETGSAHFNLLNALMYAGSLMGILLAHEFGHWVVGRLRGEKPSLPYFIPMPFGLFGTMGAVIVQREPFKNRRSLLEVALAGPIAGFIVAVPLFVIGLLLSEIKAVPATGAMFLGDSLLTRAIGLIRPVDTSTGMDIFLHPIAMGAWVGLLVTGLNLIPAGQLDGGHVAYAVLGAKARWLGYASIALLGIFSLAYSSGYLLFAVLLLTFGRSHPPVSDSGVELTPVHYLLAVIGLIVFVLTFVPAPISM